MSTQITQETFTQINNAANKFTQIVFSHTTSERGVHLETAVYAPCFLAGSLILQSTGADLSKIKPGQPVIVNISNEQYEDIVNDRGQEILKFMQKVCPLLELQPMGGWTQPVPDAHQPLQPGVELERNLEKEFLGLMEELSVPEELHSYVAAFTGMLIIRMGKQALNPDLCKAIALSALMAGCKTVPFPTAHE